MAAKTQFQAYMPLTGRRYGSFAGRTLFVPTDDGGFASDFARSDFRQADIARTDTPASSWGSSWAFSLLGGFDVRLAS